MIALNRRTRVYVCKEPTDMRASYDGLFSKAKTILDKDPFSGHLFLFVNRHRTSCKCLYYDGTGFVIISKRLEKGRFSRINPVYAGEIAMTQAEFNLFFEGADCEKRFLDSPAEVSKGKSQVDRVEPPCLVLGSMVHPESTDECEKVD